MNGQTTLFLKDAAMVDSSAKQHVPAGRRLLRSALASLLIVCVGCANVPRENTTDEEPWTSAWRSKSSDTTSFGLDSRSREIERDVGVY